MHLDTYLGIRSTFLKYKSLLQHMPLGMYTGKCIKYEILLGALAYVYARTIVSDTRVD